MLRQQVISKSKIAAIAVEKRCMSLLGKVGKNNNNTTTNNRFVVVVKSEMSQQHRLNMINTNTSSLLSSSSPLYGGSNNNVVRYFSSSDFDGPDEVIVVDTKIKIKNALLAIVLIGCCCSIGFYSVHAVGQAGKSTIDGSDDPLSNLRKEAEVYKTEMDTKTAATQEQAQRLLQTYNESVFDPDKILDAEEAEAAAAKKNRKKFLGIF